MDSAEVKDDAAAGSAAAPAQDEKTEVAKDFFVAEGESAGDAGSKNEEEGTLKDLPEEELDSRKEEVNLSESLEGVADEKKGGVDWPEKAAALKNFVKERGIVVSKVIRRLSGKKEDLEQAVETHSSEDPVKPDEKKQRWPTLSFLKPNVPNEQEPMGKSISEFEDEMSVTGRITLFSKSGCPDSKAVRSFLRTKHLPFVEINLDLFPQRGLDLEERTGTSSVPQLFFNDELVGGMEELNLLQQNGELDEKIQKVKENPCPESAPGLPVHSEEESENAVPDEFAEVVQKLREKVQLKDRFLKLRLYSKCFLGSDAVEVFAEDQYCEKDEAVEFGRKVAAKHFFHHVAHENLFEDGNNLYRFFEHDPAIATKCLNFFGATNDLEPKPAADVAKKLMTLILATYDRYISDDGKHVNYYAIATSEEFRRYVKLTEELHRIDLTTLTREEKLSFFLNIHNAMVIHSFILYGRPNGALERRTYFAEIQYVIGGYAYSLSAIQNGILRANQRPPYTLTKIFGAKDPRLQVGLEKPEPLIHFALSYGTQGSPAIRCYSPEGIDAELRIAARDFFDSGGITIDSEARTMSLSKIMKWYSSDFGKNEREVLHWIAKHINPTKAEHLLSLLEDSNVRVNYFPFDWSPNI
ncbi:uncharacterized protein LOC9652441 [Selaginella moellendorffii]|nr:uncharacterized protein LOC9652441 [Selaginella moellendorffii]XP_024522535.1 uncharacterized protein LOC9652441 [Selaginella moellendorffii]|eukprot:XP_002993098.2 uncharacterized protein LOC9652441 [Selaginella moellendorffii]